MQFEDIEDEARQELEEEKEELAKEELKDKIKEIQKAERVLEKLRNQYEDLLDKDVEEVLFE